MQMLPGNCTPCKILYYGTHEHYLGMMLKINNYYDGTEIGKRRSFKDRSRNRNLHTSKAPLESQAHDTSLFTRAEEFAEFQRGSDWSQLKEKYHDVQV